MFKANSAESEEEFTLQIETSFEELNKKRSKLNNKNRIFAEVRLIFRGGCQYTYQREGGQSAIQSMF